MGIRTPKDVASVVGVHMYVGDYSVMGSGDDDDGAGRVDVGVDDKNNHVGVIYWGRCPL